MDIKKFYDEAVQNAAKIKELVGNNAVNSKFCAMRSNKRSIICGISSVGVFEGEVKEISAESAAINNLYQAGGSYAAAMIVLDMETLEILRPDPENIRQITENNIDNMPCMVVLSMEEAAVATELIPKMNFFEGFDEASAETGTSEKEFASELEIAVDNPFAANDPEAERAVATLDSPSEPKPDTAEYINTESTVPTKEENISKEELLREAKKRKKAAKAFFNFKKKY